MTNCPDRLPDDSATNQLAVSLVLDWSAHEESTRQQRILKSMEILHYICILILTLTLSHTHSVGVHLVLSTKNYTDTSDYIGEL